MQLLENNISALLKRFSFLLMIYSLVRLHFIALYYSSIFNDFREFIQAFIHGVQFDLSILLLINLPLILAHILPLSKVILSKLKGALLWYYIIANGLILMLACIDLAYFKFTGRRTSVDVLYLGGDAIELLPSFIRDFWYLFVLYLTYLLAIWKWGVKTVFDESYPFSFRSILTIIVFIGLSFIGIRGGISFRPITPVTAFKYVSDQYANTVTNTPFVFYYSLTHRGLEKKSYFSDQELDDLDLERNYFSKHGTKKNVVLIVLESFGKEYIGFHQNDSSRKSLTPFLDSVMNHSLVFTNAYANNRTSIKSLNSILTGVPEMMSDPFIHSIYQNNQLPSIKHILKNYQTVFFHGAKNGSMSFDMFMNKLDFDAYYGLNEYRQKRKEGIGPWGVHDLEFLDFTNQEMGSLQQPFFSCVFTLSSHHPFELPEAFKNKFQEGSLPIHKTIEYSDYALKQFFLKSKQSDWYENTLFIITADHTSLTEVYLNKLDNNRYRVPLAFFEPGIDSFSIDSSIVQHVDILPSIVDYLDVNESFESLGRSVWDTVKTPKAVQRLASKVQLIKGDYMLQLRGETDSLWSFYNYIEHPRLNKNLKKSGSTLIPEYEAELKAVLQTYHQSMIENTFVP